MRLSNGAGDYPRSRSVRETAYGLAGASGKTKTNQPPLGHGKVSLRASLARGLVQNNVMTTNAHWPGAGSTPGGYVFQIGGLLEKPAKPIGGKEQAGSPGNR